MYVLHKYSQVLAKFPLRQTGRENSEKSIIHA